MDYSSLRIGKQWRKGICENVASSVAVAEVDAHNVVPIWCASDKMEYGARTIRTKITKLLPEFLNEYPVLENPGKPWTSEAPDAIDWDSLIAEVTRYVDVQLKLVLTATISYYCYLQGCCSTNTAGSYNGLALDTGW
jgi:hypothetical protein